jgi:branched-subunit amino acid permease
MSLTVVSAIIINIASVLLIANHAARINSFVFRMSRLFSCLFIFAFYLIIPCGET